jgi:hypothetical protein
MSLSVARPEGRETGREGDRETGRDGGRQGGRSHICRSCRSSSPLPHLGTEGKAGKNGSVVESGGRVVSAKRMVGAGDGTK